jgi:hypothetical protein
MIDLKFHHIGIITRDIEKCSDSFLNLSIVTNFGEIHKEESQGVNVRFGTNNDGILYEIIEPLNSESPINNALIQGKNIINHIGYIVKSIDDTISDLAMEKLIPIGNPNPSRVFNYSRVQFIYLSSNMLIELIETDEPDSFNLL